MSAPTDDPHADADELEADGSDGESAAPDRSGAWPWDFRVDRLFWVVGVVVLAVATAIAALVRGEVEPSANLAQLLVIVVTFVVGAWGVGRWLTGPDYPPVGRRTGIIYSLVFWFVFAAILRWVWSRWALGPVPALAPEFGVAERLVLAPALGAFVMVVARRYHLHRGVSVLAALAIGLGFASQSGPGVQGDYASIATRPALAASLKTGEPVLLRGVELQRGGGVAQTRGPEAKDCERVRTRDERHTLFGFPGRSLDAWVEACWDADGHVVSVASTQRIGRRWELGPIKPLRLSDLSTFDSDGISDDSDPGVVASDYGAKTPAAGTAARDGRRLLFDDGKPADDGNADTDWVKVLVGRDPTSGAAEGVTVVAAYELTDPRAPRGPGETGARVERRYLELGRSRPGVAIDVFIAHLEPGGSRQGSITRWNRQGNQLLASGSGDRP